MDRLSYRLQLMDYGPFTLPKRDKWLIVGSGPTFDSYDPRVRDEGFGVISLNSTLVPIEGRVDAHIFSHYEDLLPCWNSLDKTDIAFLANPMHVGYRCMPISAMNLLNIDDIELLLPDKIRFFEKEMDITRSKNRMHTLYCQCTIASAAIALLWRNDVRECWTLGLDGGEGNAKKMLQLHWYVKKFRTHQPHYNYARAEVQRCARDFGIKLNVLERNLCSA